MKPADSENRNGKYEIGDIVEKLILNEQKTSQTGTSINSQFNEKINICGPFVFVFIFFLLVLSLAKTLLNV